MDETVNLLESTDRRTPLRVHTPAEADAFVRTCRDAGYEFIRFEIADMAGLSRGKTVPLAHVAGYLRTGLNLYGGMLALDSYSIPVRNSGYNEERNYSDCIMIADTESLTPVPWLKATGRVVCDSMWYDGTAQHALPRLVLKHVLERAQALGYDVMMGHEYEFYVVDPATRKPVFDGQPIFVTERTHQLPAIDRLISVLQAQGIDIITSNVEHGPGQFEINYSANVGVRAADQAFIFKNTVKEYLRKEGLLATFMTKPYKGISGRCIPRYAGRTRLEWSLP
jgi:glutamine synthetase